MIEVYNDAYFMKQAIDEAKKAFDEGEVPVGAVVVCDKKIIARGYNQVERLRDVTAHAEILAITGASDYLGSKYLQDCTLYVTLEPCAMCAGAIAWAQIGTIVYGASDDKKGFMQFGKRMLHPKTKLAYGFMMEECSLLLKEFFKRKRIKEKDLL